MEPQKSRTEVDAGILIAVFAGHGLNLAVVGQRSFEHVEVERPRVDVRVDAEVSSSAEEERLARFIVGTGMKKNGTRRVNFVLCDSAAVQDLVAHGHELVSKDSCAVCQHPIGGIKRSVQILFGKSFDFLFVGRESAGIG